MVLDFLASLIGYRRVTATSVLKTTGGTPVKGASVTLSYSKVSGVWSKDGTGLTDSTGTVKDSVFLRRGSGIYTFRMSFAGGGGYGPSSAQNVATV